MSLPVEPAEGKGTGGAEASVEAASGTTEAVAPPPSSSPSAAPATVAHGVESKTAQSEVASKESSDEVVANIMKKL